MQALFDKELIRMEQEVRDLKTFCKRAVGATRFYAKELTIQNTPGAFYKVRATTMAGEPSPALIMIYIKITPDGDLVTGTTAAAGWRELDFASMTTGAFTVKAISTSNLTLEQIQ